MATAGGARGGGAERAFAAVLPPSGPVVLSSEESAHLVRSRRVSVGDEVVLFDGRGATRRGRMVQVDARAAVVEVLGEAPDREPARALRLFVSPPEAPRTDDMVSALAELGVAHLTPLVCTRTPAGRLEGWARRAERHERLLVEAAKVSGRSRFLTLGAARTLAEVLAAPPVEGLRLLDPDPAAPWFADTLPSEGPLPWLLVGPEGGFTPAEVAAARAAGVSPVRIAATTLRVERAAVAAAAQALGRR